MQPHAPPEVLLLADVSLVRDGTTILDHVDWVVRTGERWVVLGANGSGKTSLIRLASLYGHPSSGSVTVLGERLGRTDVRTLRRRIGVASAALSDQLRPALTATEVVMTARHAALEPWWHRYDEADRVRATELLARMGCAPLTDRPLGTLSSGERQRVALARTLMAEPELVLLDEPTAGLDLAGREGLIDRLGLLAADPATPPTVLVTHHTEEIPPGFTHALLLRAGRVQAAGPITAVLTATSLSECFGVALELEHRHGRWQAWASLPRP
ncbi:ABC transporter ATP-binding protein [soil metagenome]